MSVFMPLMMHAPFDRAASRSVVQGQIASYPKNRGCLLVLYYHVFTNMPQDVASAVEKFKYLCSDMEVIRVC